MKKFLLLLLTFISLSSFAQIKVKEGSFHQIQGYVMLDKEDHIDVNDAPMALIKISTENITAEERRRITFKGNLITYFDVQFEPSEIYLYITAEAATFLEIHHPDYGKTEYWLPQTLKPYCGYEMVVQHTRIEPEYGFLTISSNPDGADIYIDNILQEKKTNAVISNLSSGNHTLKLEKEGYSSLTKDFVIIKGETLELDENLQKQSNEKYHLIVKADQAEAMIFIDDNAVSAGEASMLFAKGTTHTWKIECNLYHSENGTVTINERVTIDKKLRPAFGYLNVATTPEQGAMVYVDGDYVGVSPIKTDKLKSGSHTVRVMKEMYKMKEQSFTVTDGQTTNATLNIAANFVNVTINTDSQSDIYVDEEYKGKGRWTGRLSDGSHIFEARKQNHKPTQKTLDLVLGETKTVTLEAPKPINGSCEINSSPMGATIYIDGKNYGETPNYINEILIGNHELKLEKQGCTTVTKTINIKEGETLSVNEKMLSQQTTDNRQQNSGNVNNQTFTVKGVSFTMIAVEGGTFKMGATSEQGSDAYSEESPVHSVTLSDYYIGETEVTQELWQAVMGSNPSYYKGSNKPVEKVSWNDCQEFIKKLNQLTGKNFRLPTEAEWEYAARGGNKSKGYKYSGSNSIGNVAWYWDNSGSTTHNVKTKSANELGIYDMSGNVYEWCRDWYGNYSSVSRTNPKGPSSGSYRVRRGGSWYFNASYCRVSNRYFIIPGYRDGSLGLRLCLSQY